MITDLLAKNLEAGAKPVFDGLAKGLRLESTSTRGRGKWILRFVSPVTGKRRDYGLGIYPEVSVDKARLEAMKTRELIREGRDPVAERATNKNVRRAEAEALTFKQAAEKVHGEQKPGWKNPKHADQWINTLTTYAFPSIGKMKLADLQPSDFAELLRPIWLTKPETASRVRQRCETVMKWAWAHGKITSNPVSVVEHLLPQQPGKRERTVHHPSMRWQEVPAFIEHTLRNGSENVTRSLLEFVILTAARSGEARLMEWAEVDLEGKTWTVPATRMKAGIRHRVPLADRAIEILNAQRKKHPEGELVFRAPRGGALSDMALTKFLRDKMAASSEPDKVATAHGFRSSFRDWCSEHGYARDLAERALAHTIFNKSEAAYHRTDLLDQRRPMMETWAKFVAPTAAEEKDGATS